MNHSSNSCHIVTEISARKKILKNKNVVLIVYHLDTLLKTVQKNQNVSRARKSKTFNL